MNPTSESFDQPTQVGKTGGKALTAQQKKRIYAGLGGVAALAGGSALTWGMQQDGKANENHPKTETKPASESHKPVSETPADSTHVTTNAHPNVAQNNNSTTTAEPTPSTSTTHEPMIATHVTDQMSFEDAFKTARQEVGPGGYFEWNGHFYNTYYKEEWDAMTTQQREEYAATVYGNEVPDHSSLHSINTSSTTSAPDIKVGEYNGHVIGMGDIDHDGDSEVIVIDGTVAAVDKDNDGIMETRVELDPNTHQIVSQAPLATPFEAPNMNALGTSPSTPSTFTANSDQQADVHTVEYQGHVVTLADGDHDGDAEVLIIDGTVGVVDTDNDGIMETQFEIDPNTHQVIGQSPMKEAYSAPAMTAFDGKPNTPVATDTTNDVDVVRTTVDGHAVTMGDSNHDGYADVVILDTGVGAMDVDGDHQFETAVKVDMNTGEVLATAPLDHTYEAPVMDGTTSSESHTDLAHDYDNNADVSDWVA
ncbi:hypothetical protein WBJ53_21060 [Spirosoma sp. SC4-14]|uniref:hypothetical protein n=1 Tax=Spirosoma sp. SC4-14 TaxID=3128900 RepID=UPI0030CB13A5